MKVEITTTFNHFDGTTPQSWSLAATFDTIEERDAFVARFPKSTKVRATTLTTASAVLPYAVAGGDLVPDAVNGGINETGLRRLDKVLALAPEATYVAKYGNSFPTLDAFRSAVAVR